VGSIEKNCMDPADSPPRFGNKNRLLFGFDCKKKGSWYHRLCPDGYCWILSSGKEGGMGKAAATLKQTVGGFFKGGEKNGRNFCGRLSELVALGGRGTQKS